MYAINNLLIGTLRPGVISDLADDPTSFQAPRSFQGDISMRYRSLILCAPLPTAAWISHSRPRFRSALFNDWNGDSESWSDDASAWATDGTGGSEDSSAESWSAWNDGDAGPSPNDEGSVRSASTLGDEAVDDAFISSQIASTLDDEAADAFISAAQAETAEVLLAEERRDAQRARMIAAGATPAQIAAFLGGEAAPDVSADDAVLDSGAATSFALPGVGC